MEPHRHQRLLTMDPHQPLESADIRNANANVAAIAGCAVNGQEFDHA